MPSRPTGNCHRHRFLCWWECCAKKRHRNGLPVTRTSFSDGKPAYLVANLLGPRRALWLALEPRNEWLVGRGALLGNAVCGERCGAGTTR